MPEIRIVAVGDVSLRTDENPFQKLEETLSSKGILIGNLETALSRRGDMARKTVAISTDPRKVQFLKEAGFDILNLANNHILDRGFSGLVDTISVLDSVGIQHIGAGIGNLLQNPAVIKRLGITLGFLGYDQYGYSDIKKGIFVSGLDRNTILSDISKLRSDCNIIIVSLHWGIENVYYPSPKQIELAHAIIDAGASVILGHHPHVLQGIERYNGGLIAYSLGNFQFQYAAGGLKPTPNFRPDYSMILSIVVGENGLSSYEIIPVIIDENDIPSLPDELTRKNINSLIDRISAPLKNGGMSSQEWFDKVASRYIGDSARSWITRIKSFGLSHLLSFIKWLITPFVIRCLFTMVKQSLKGERSIRIENEVLPEDAGLIANASGVNQNDKIMVSQV